jgi:hypothetical protein
MAKKVKDAIDKGAKRAKDATDKAAAATKKATDRAAKAAKDATDKVAGSAKAAADRVEGARETLKKSGEKIAKQGSAVSMKMIEHAEENTHQAFAAMRAAASAKNPAEVAKIQGDYLKQQGARALAHAREVGELILRFGRDAVGEGKK